MTDRRVLMFAYWFPPCLRWASAADRSAGLARYLPQFGWKPTVVAPQSDPRLCTCAGCLDGPPEIPGVDVARVALRPRLGMARRGAAEAPAVPATLSPGRAAALAAAVLEVRSNWVPAAERFATTLLSREQWAAVWTTSGPYVSARIGRYLQRRHEVVWAADLRDPVSRVRGQGHLETRLTKLRRRGLRRTFQRADLLTAVSSGVADVDSRWLRQRIEVVPPGYDPEHWKRLWDRAAPGDRSAFTIVYAGRFYPGYIDPRRLLAGLRLLQNRRPDQGAQVKLVYCGPDGDYLRSRAGAEGVADLVDDRGFLPDERLREVLASADLLYLATNEPGDQGVPGGKLTTYLAARRPVLAVPAGDHQVNETLERTKAGVALTTAEEVADYLASAMDLWRADGGLRYRGEPAVLDQHSAVGGARRVGELLDQCLAMRQ